MPSPSAVLIASGAAAAAAFAPTASVASRRLLRPLSMSASAANAERTALFTTADYRRPLHWVFKIGSLKDSLGFYTDTFGMKIHRHEEFASGCEATCNGPYGGAWSKTMIGFGPEDTDFALELTYNYGIDSYALGNDLRYIAMNSAVSKKGAGAFDAPDGYTFRAFDGARAEEPTDFLLVSIHVSDLAKARSFYVDTLGGTVYEGATGAGETGGAASLVLGWGGVGAAKLELVELPGGQAVDHKLGGGRLAMETEDGAPTSMAGKVAAAGREVRHGPIKLAPHNEEVAIVVDDDGHEYCYVDARGYTNCIDVRGKAGGDEVSWAYRDLLEECSARGGATPAEKVTLAKLMAGDYDKAEARARLDALTAGPCVVVSQSGCPFCAKAKAALADLGAAYTEVNLDEQADGKALRAELCDLTGRSSVPNIFLAGASIGGYSDGLEPLLESGGAAGKLKAAGAL